MFQFLSLSTFSYSTIIFVIKYLLYTIHILWIWKYPWRGISKSCNFFIGDKSSKINLWETFHKEFFDFIKSF